MKETTFESLGVSGEIATMLKNSGIVTPTEAQILAIPKARKGGDLIFSPKREREKLWRTFCRFLRN